MVPRPRLFRLLDRVRPRPLVWISGPAGSGKTTLAASYLHDRRLRSLWYRVDEADRDVAGFFHGLKQAADAFAPGPRRPLPLLTPEYRPGLGAFTRRYFEQLAARLGRRCVLVLDNYQTVGEDAALHEVVGEAVSVLPRGISLFLLSRGAPPPALRPQASRLTGHQGAGELLRRHPTRPLSSSTTNNAFGLPRYNSNGTLDTGFGTNGTVITDFFGFDDRATFVAALPNGKLWVAGQAGTASSGLFAPARYSGDGTLDTSFGTNG